MKAFRSHSGCTFFVHILQTCYDLRQASVNGHNEGREIFLSSRVKTVGTVLFKMCHYTGGCGWRGREFDVTVCVLGALFK